MGGGFDTTPWPLQPRERPIPVVQEAGWDSGLVWTGTENRAPTGTWSSDRPARGESLYRLRYPGQQLFQEAIQIPVPWMTTIMVIHFVPTVFFYFYTPEVKRRLVEW